MTMPLAALQHATLVLVIVWWCIHLVQLLARGRAAKRRRPVHRLPPSPWALPVIGNLHQLLLGSALPHRALHALAAAHGPSVMLLRLGRAPTLVVSSAGAAREVLLLHDRAFASRPPLAVPRGLLYGCTDIAFAPHGAYWRRVRKIAVHHLLSPPMVRACRGVRLQEVAALLRRVDSEQQQQQVSMVRLSDLLGDFAKDVNGRIVLGVRASGAGPGWRGKVDALLEEANALLGAFHVGDYFPGLAWVAALDGTDAKVSRAFRRIDRILEEIIAVAESADMGLGARFPAFVHTLLSLQRNHTGTGWRLSRDNIKALLEDLFGAGTDSTIIVLEWVMAELLCNKEAMQKLQQEIRRHCRNADDDSLLVTEEDLPPMEYLRAVIKETMRLHPPGPLLVPRESMQHARIHGYDVPCGTRVVVNAWSIGRDTTAWERASEFWPDRFLGSTVDFRGRHPQLIPFGAGRRMCPGIGFTTAVVELALANLMARYDWTTLPTETKLDMEEAPGITSRKRLPIYCAVVRHGQRG